MEMLLQLTRRYRLLLGSVLVAVLLSTCPSSVFGAEEKKSVDLALRQSQIADRYRQLETMLLKMAEYDASTNPRRAALLRQTLAKSKERQLNGRLNELVKLFQREQLQKAVDGQISVNSDLKELLDLLLSEDRPDRIKNEQARVRGYIKQLDRMIRKQKSIQGRTEGGTDTKRMAEDQKGLADQTKKLGDDIDEAEGTPSENADSDTDSSESKNDAGKPGEGKAGEEEAEATPSESGGSESKGSEGKADEGKPNEDQKPKDSDDNTDKNGKPNDNKDDGDPSDSEPSEGQPSEGQPSEGQPSEGQPQQGQPGSPQQQQQQQQQTQQEQQFPGRKRIAAAEDRMRQAQKDLEDAKRDNAVEKQEEARRLLEQAKAELEEILRQLREEEIERVLAMLEGRFRRMLDMELKIQDNTVRLSKTPAAKRTRQFTVKSGKLSLDQRKVVLEVDKALALLREEGSSAAFPEAVDQMRVDMDTVAKRLSEEKVGELTQAVIDDIVAALEEMIAALQKAQQEAEERRNQQSPPPGQGGGGDPSNQPLVNQIAELKMIRALQMRVNTRTQRFAKMLQDFEDPIGQATEADLLESIQDLSDRQQRIHKVTSDIILGKNQ